LFHVPATVKYLINPNLGLYLHIPFCLSKCAYCDFYSVIPNEELLNNYTKALIREIKQWGGKINRPIATIYLGGGTPSLLKHRLSEIIGSVKSYFKVLSNAEITLEMNPSGDIEEMLFFAEAAGVNRLSIGAQSGIDKELLLLGRRHSAKDTVNAVNLARKAGFDNISLDIMLGLPYSTADTLNESLEFIYSLDPEHISAYILKIEENTPLYKRKNEISFPDDDRISDQYLQMCAFLESRGYIHYEISNFSKEGYESRHNLKYWNLDPYLGIGPSAHSFLDGKRFFYKKNLPKFIEGEPVEFDCYGGQAEEFIMLKLRTLGGIDPMEFESCYGKPLGDRFYEQSLIFEKHGLMSHDNGRYFLTDKGMLLSNSIISKILECLV
jgi:oxygen-independent coproporphyrinogen-3 oxidase